MATTTTTTTTVLNESKQVFGMLIESKPDDEGRQSFTLFWRNGERNRAQCFRAHVADYAARSKLCETEEEAKRVGGWK